MLRGIRIEVRALEGVAVLLDQRLERGLPAFGQDLRLRHWNRHRAVPRRPLLLDLRGEIRRQRGRVRRGQRFHFDDHRLAFGQFSREGDVVAVVVPLEELVGGGAEAVTDFLGLAAAHGADVLPGGLHPLEFRGRRIPLGGLAQLLCALDEGVLGGEVVRPDLLARREVLAAAREERVRRGAEALGQIAARIPRRGAGFLPGLLQFLEPRGRPRPVRRVGERFGFLDDRRALLQARAPLLAQLLEVRFAARPDEVRRRPEAIPEPLRRIARGFGDFLPLRVQFLQRPGGGAEVGILALLGLELERRHDGLGHRDELLLALGVREAAPLVHFAQFADARRYLLLQRAQGCQRLGDFTRRFDLAGLVHAGRDVTEESIALAQRDRVRFGRAARAFNETRDLSERRLLCFGQRFTALRVPRCFAACERFTDRG